MNPSVYTAEFRGGYTARMELDVTGMHITWSPGTPRFKGQAARKFMQAYRTWRDDCIADYAKRTGLSIAVMEA